MNQLKPQKAWWAVSLLLVLLASVSILTLQRHQRLGEGGDPPSAVAAGRKLMRRKLVGLDNDDGDDATGAIQKLNAIDDPKVLNIHVVPHTHDDVGWLKTVEQYYYGLNMSIQAACVKDILDTVVEALLENPNHTFTYVEIKFFSMWWQEQNDATKDAVRFLIANKQLTFTNGGWCMHDEAATHFMGMIDQTTMGHDFLKRELGVIPKVGWQLDPFGHSATQASLFTSGLGFDALYFGRIDYQDLQIRHDTQECEGLWSSSKSAGPKGTIYWGLTGSYLGNYQAPTGFCFDTGCNDESIIDMNRTALIKKVKTFLDEIKVQSDQTKGNHIMLTMGSDFNYKRAAVYFANLDLLMGSVQRFQQWGLVNITEMMGPRFERINMFYSSPEYYTKIKHQQTLIVDSKSHHQATTPQNNHQSLGGAPVNWTVKTDDFFPYSDCPHCFWTGYFTSRTALKRLERVGSSFLLAARQIESFPENASDAVQLCEQDCSCSGLSDCDKPLYDLEDAMGVAQHHDAVSGTAKQHVAQDYARRIQAGMNKAADYVSQKLKRLLAKDGDALNAVENLSYCQRINETICEISQDATKEAGRDLYVVVYNALASTHGTIVRLPVSASGSFNVARLDGKPVKASSVPSTPSPFNDENSMSAEYVLLFDTGPLSPAGATVFRVTKSLDATFNRQSESMKDQRYLESVEDEVVESNGLITVHFDRESGAMTSVSTNETSLNVTQTWGYYTSFDNKMDNSSDDAWRGDQNSGAYVFRPSVPDQSLKTIGYKSNGAKFVNTSVGMEVHVEFEEPWIKQVTRVMEDLPFIEVEYRIGPIPIDDARGKEIVTRLSTPVKSNQTFYTDSNGREFQQRHRDSRPSWPLQVFEPVAGNYYPVNAAIYIEDEVASLSVLVDRTQSGSSLVDGSIELMAQRRLLADDARGVGEPLNETDGGVTPYPPFGHHRRWGNGAIFRGTYRIMVGKGKSGATLARSEMDRAFASPLIFAASSPSASNPANIRDSFTSLKESLPANIMLITFKKISDSDSTYLVRLGHQYGVGDNEALSAPVSVDLSKLFAKYKLVAVDEMTLSGNQLYNDWVNRRLDWVGSGPLPESDVDDTHTVVTMKPMEVRSFLMKLVPNQPKTRG